MLYELEIRRDGVVQRLLSFLTLEEINAAGALDPRGIVAAVAENGAVQINSVFREYLHKTIARLAPLELADAAQHAGNGRVVYIDDRAPADREPTAVDIIGWFRVVDGVAVDYEPNPEHRLKSDRGWSQAIGKFREAMREELASRSAAPPPAES
ncbi:MAG: hypothetical protein FJW30_29880 [Acidobacteria bacterium]|nr:hypothetical protein [Acidobacteriota bacterium]